VSHPRQKVHSVILWTSFLFRPEKSEVYAVETLLFGLERRMISDKNTYRMLYWNVQKQAQVQLIKNLKSNTWTVTLYLKIDMLKSYLRSLYK